MDFETLFRDPLELKTGRTLYNYVTDNCKECFKNKVGEHFKIFNKLLSKNERAVCKMLEEIIVKFEAIPEADRRQTFIQMVRDRCEQDGGVLRDLWIFIEFAATAVEKQRKAKKVAISSELAPAVMPPVEKKRKKPVDPRIIERRTPSPEDPWARYNALDRENQKFPVVQPSEFSPLSTPTPAPTPASIPTPALAPTPAPPPVVNGHVDSIGRPPEPELDEAAVRPPESTRPPLVPASESRRSVERDLGGPSSSRKRPLDDASRNGSSNHRHRSPSPHRHQNSRNGFSHRGSSDRPHSPHGRSFSSQPFRPRAVHHRPPTFIPRPRHGLDIPGYGMSPAPAIPRASLMGPYRTTASFRDQQTSVRLPQLGASEPPRRPRPNSAVPVPPNQITYAPPAHPDRVPSTLAPATSAYQRPPEMDAHRDVEPPPSPSPVALLSSVPTRSAMRSTPSTHVTREEPAMPAEPIPIDRSSTSVVNQSKVEPPAWSLNTLDCPLIFPYQMEPSHDPMKHEDMWTPEDDDWTFFLENSRNQLKLSNPVLTREKSRSFCLISDTLFLRMNLDFFNIVHLDVSYPSDPRWVNELFSDPNDPMLNNCAISRFFVVAGLDYTLNIARYEDAVVLMKDFMDTFVRCISAYFGSGKQFEARGSDGNVIKVSYPTPVVEFSTIPKATLNDFATSNWKIGMMNDGIKAKAAELVHAYPFVTLFDWETKAQNFVESTPKNFELRFNIIESHLKDLGIARVK